MLNDRLGAGSQLCCCPTCVLSHLPANFQHPLEVLDGGAELTLQPSCCSQTTRGATLLDLRDKKPDVEANTGTISSEKIDQILLVGLTARPICSK
jgi:hypothetical protein